MPMIELSQAQVGYIEERLDAFDGEHIPFRMNGSVQIGFEEDGKLVAGLDACITAFKIMYVSTVFVEEAYRRRGIGSMLIHEMERRAAAMGVNTIRLDTFSWQGREFYEALGYTAVGHYRNAEDDYSEFFFIKRLV